MKVENEIVTCLGHGVTSKGLRISPRQFYVCNTLNTAESVTNIRLGTVLWWWWRRQRF